MIMLRDLMSRNIDWASPHDPISDVAKKMEVLNVSALPVCENGRIIGMLTRSRISTLRRTRGARANPIRAGEAMTREVTYGTDTQDVKDAIRIMREKKLGTMPVVDAMQHLIGIFQLGM